MLKTPTVTLAEKNSQKKNFTFHLSPRIGASTAGCNPPLIPSIALCCFVFEAVPSLLAMLSCHFLLGRPLDLFPLLDCHSVQRLVHLLSVDLAICLSHFHFCFSVHSMMSIVFVLFLISLSRVFLSCSFRFNIFFSITL